jgi:streptomycin 3"-kinase
VPVGLALLAELLPSDSGDWEAVTGGESGASVFRDQGQQRYAKVVTSAQAGQLAAERDRSVWLDQTAVASAAVLDWRESGAGACLVTRAVPGVPASELGAVGLRRAWPSVVDTVRRLHGLATDRCPFDRGLVQMMALAEAGVAEGRVVVEFLPVALQRTPPELILDRIRAELPARLAQESAELVVGHGDLCLPNILVDPRAGLVTGLIDLGRLGTADPYGDIALLLATAREIWPDGSTARRAEQEFVEVYGAELDPERRDFYLRLDPLTW